jgi:hypothetical protein
VRKEVALRPANAATVAAGNAAYRVTIDLAGFDDMGGILYAQPF